MSLPLRIASTLFFLIGLGLAFAQQEPSITVTSPNGGEQVLRGQTFTITWTSSNVTGNVAIELLQNDSLVGVIASAVPVTSGQFTWTGGRLEDGTPVSGTGFKIRVKAPPPRTIRFTTEGNAFAPVLVVNGSPTIQWTFSDGSTSSSPTPSKTFGSAASRQHTLLVTPWSALQRINIGYDAGDGGSSAIEYVPDQHVSCVQNLDLVAPTLGQWCSSYNLFTSLDFSNFVNLDTIECFLSQTLTSVKLANTPKLKRACFEDCNLSTLDLSESPLLEDLRGAVNNYPTINFGSIGAHTWHICIRDNPQMTDRNLFADMTQFPNISELFIWNDNQTGVLKIPHCGNWLSLLADGNAYTSVDLEGALINPTGNGYVSLRNNQITTLNITGCVQIMEMYLENNLLGESQLDNLLNTLDTLGRSKSPIDIYTRLILDIRGNATPSTAGHASAVNLAAKGWRILAEGWTLEPPPPPDTGEARIDFTTHRDVARMSCSYWGSPTATWHWSDGTTSAATSGLDQVKSGLGEGEHAHYLIISNGSALTRFGGAGGGGLGNLVSMSGLNNAPLLDVLYAYNESQLGSLSHTNATRIREYHLMGTALSPASMDQIFADAVATGVTSGTMWCPNSGTSASAIDRATLTARGWSLNF